MAIYNLAQNDGADDSSVRRHFVIELRLGMRSYELMTVLAGYEPVQSLLVDDSPAYVRLTRQAFRCVNSPFKLHVAIDGVEATAFLRREGKHADVTRPDLILLDLNLPTTDGREVQTLVNEDDVLKSVATVVLTSSGPRADIVKSYPLPTNCYLTKPADFGDLKALVKSINESWLEKRRLPQQSTANA